MEVIVAKEIVWFFFLCFRDALYKLPSTLSNVVKVSYLNMLLGQLYSRHGHAYSYVLRSNLNRLLHRKGLNNLDIKVEGTTKFRNLQAQV